MADICCSLGDIAAHAGQADLQARGVLFGLLQGRARPMRLEGFRACIDLVQHQRIGFLLWHEYFERQGAGLGCQAAMGMSLEMLEVFIPLSRYRLDGRDDCKFAHRPVPLKRLWPARAAASW